MAILKVTEGLTGDQAAQLLYDNDLENQASTALKADASDVYTKSEVYIKSEVYTKGQVSALIAGSAGGAIVPPNIAEKPTFDFSTDELDIMDFSVIGTSQSGIFTLEKGAAAAWAGNFNIESPAWVDFVRDGILYTPICFLTSDGALVTGGGSSPITVSFRHLTGQVMGLYARDAQVLSSLKFFYSVVWVPKEEAPPILLKGGYMNYGDEGEIRIEAGGIPLSAPITATGNVRFDTPEGTTLEPFSITLGAGDLYTTTPIFGPYMVDAEGDVTFQDVVFSPAAVDGRINAIETYFEWW